MLEVKTTSNSTKGYYKIINVEGSWLELSPEQSAEIREIRNEARQLRDGKGLDLNPDAGEQEVDKAIAAYKEKTKTEKVSVTDIKAVKEKIKGAA